MTRTYNVPCEGERLALAIQLSALQAAERKLGKALDHLPRDRRMRNVKAALAILGDATFDLRVELENLDPHF